MYRLLLLCFLVAACNATQEKQNDSAENKQDVQLPAHDNASYPEYVKLQGKWISEESKNYCLEFEKNMFVEKSGEKTDISKYLLLNHCTNAENTDAAAMDNVYIGFEVEGSNETYCQYEIMGVTDKTLSLMVVENGKILVFHKQ